MYYISDYREGNRFSGVYLCKQKQILKTKAGKTYYSLILQDKTGTVDGKIWELGGGISEFEQMDYIACEGQVTSFQGNLQVNISRVRVADEGEFDPSDYIPCSDKDIDKMYTELTGFVDSISDKYLLQLLDNYFKNNSDFIDEFKKHSAAKSVHHSFMGGLLEHTLAVTRLCEIYSKQYKRINRDLLITAALLHDMGKIYELSSFPSNDYTDDGNLLGHIYMGARLIENECDKIAGFPAELRSELVHCILAHHGKLEFGSPKTPGIIEALALHIADNTDAKLQTMTEVLNGAGDEMGWLGFNRLLESNIRQTKSGTKQ
ncbi:MAG: HD domain-containing protein [Eubacterium sp.]|nr:HD domain-containing protein [Eubacterium sp.]